VAKVIKPKTQNPKPTEWRCGKKEEVKEERKKKNQIKRKKLVTFLRGQREKFSSSSSLSLISLLQTHHR